MELLAKYIDEINKDLVVTDFNIKDIQLKLPSRKHFWVARLIDAKIKREKLIKHKKAFNTTYNQTHIKAYKHIKNTYNII